MAYKTLSERLCKRGGRAPDPGVRLPLVIPVIMSVFALVFASLAYCGDMAMPRFMFSIDRFFDDRFDVPAGIFVDRENGELYVTDSGREEVLLFDSRGTPIHRFGKSSGITNPIDVVVKNDRIYVSQQANPYIDILSFTGEPVGRLAPLEIPFYPGKMDIDKEGNIYVVNTARNNCVVFDNEDRFAGTIGEGYRSISGVAASSDRVYLLTPAEAHSVQVYAKSGEFITAFEGIEGKGGKLGLPSSAKVDKQGRLWIADALRGVFIYDKNFKRIGGFGWFGPVKGALVFPVDIDFDGKNSVYILEKANKRVSVFK